MKAKLIQSSMRHPLVKQILTKYQARNFLFAIKYFHFDNHWSNTCRSPAPTPTDDPTPNEFVAQPMRLLQYFQQAFIRSRLLFGAIVQPCCYLHYDPWVFESSITCAKA